MKQINRAVHRLRGTSALAKLDLAQYAVSHLKGNIHFTSLATQVEDLERAADVLASAITAANTGDHELVGRKQIAERELMLKIGKICSAVNGVAGGNRAKLISSGLPLRRENTPIGELPPPTGLISRYNSSGGKTLAWKGPKGSITYTVLISPSNEPFAWERHAYTTKQSHRPEGLVPGQFYWFAIIATGTAGESGMSAPFQLMGAA